MGIKPLGSRSSHTASGASTNTSMKRQVDLGLSNDPPRSKAIAGVRRDERRHRHDASLGEQLRYFSGPSDVLGAIGRREPEVGIQAASKIVAVEHEHLMARLEERPLEGPASVDLPEAGSPVNRRRRRDYPDGVYASREKCTPRL